MEENIRTCPVCNCKNALSTISCTQCSWDLRDRIYLTDNQALEENRYINARFKKHQHLWRELEFYKNEYRSGRTLQEPCYLEYKLEKDNDKIFLKIETSISIQSLPKILVVFYHSEPPIKDKAQIAFVADIDFINKNEIRNEWKIELNLDSFSSSSDLENLGCKLYLKNESDRDEFRLPWGSYATFF